MTRINRWCGDDRGRLRVAARASSCAGAVRPGTCLARLNSVLHRAVLALVLLCTLGRGVSAAPAPQSASPNGADQPVSVQRVGEGLKRPELQIPPLPPPPLTFRTEVTERLETPLDVIRRELQEEARVRLGLPTRQGLDLLPALVGLVDKVKSIRRAHAEAEARQMVQRELDAFCRVHDCSEIEREPVSEGVLP